MYILMCKITLLYSALSISKVLRHSCPVLGPYYHSATQKRIILVLQLLTVNVITDVTHVCYVSLIYFFLDIGVGG